MPSARPEPHGTFLKTLFLPAGELGRYPDLARDLCLGRFDVAVVRGVFSRQEMDGVLERLVRGEHDLHIAPQSAPDPEVPQVTIFGESITPNDLDKDADRNDRYHANAERFRASCRSLFRGFPDYESRIDELFARVSGGAAIDVPRDRQGRIFSPSTIRRVAPESEMNLHVGNYFLGTPAYAYLNTLFAKMDQLSFFIPISPPQSGGEIEVFEMRFEDPRARYGSDGWIDAPWVEREFRHESYAPGAGDMFLFNGGRFYHRVDHVRGPRHRWTIGGFMAFATDESTLYHWG